QCNRYFIYRRCQSASNFLVSLSWSRVVVTGTINSCPVHIHKKRCPIFSIPLKFPCHRLWYLAKTQLQVLHRYNISCSVLLLQSLQAQFEPE
ncbi:hypothetical protein T310_9440, partial [Rasamsonia emersonii CBS 393.64]